MFIKRMIAVLLAIGFAGCKDPNTYEPPPTPKVTVSQPVQKTVVNYLDATGSTEAVQLVEVRARVKGFLEYVAFEVPGAEAASEDGLSEGDDVQEGQVLFRIEDRSYKATETAALADVEARRVDQAQADTEWKRQQNLFDEKATAEINLVAAKAAFDASIAAVKVAEAAVDQASLDVEYTVVKAPISGRVGKALVKRGNLVGDGEATHLTTIIQYDPIYANFTISELALLSILDARRDGGEQKEVVKLYLGRGNDTGFPFEGEFDYADLSVDSSTGTFTIRGVFPNPDLAIVPGLFVRIRIPVGQLDNAILVPERALSADQGGRFLLVVNSENKVERRTVTLGPKEKGMQVIKTGLRVGEWVITDGLQRARPGAEVDPTRVALTGDPPPEESPPQDPGSDEPTTNE